MTTFTNYKIKEMKIRLIGKISLIERKLIRAHVDYLL